MRVVQIFFHIEGVVEGHPFQIDIDSHDTSNHKAMLRVGQEFKKVDLDLAFFKNKTRKEMKKHLAEIGLQLTVDIKGEHAETRLVLSTQHPQAAVHAAELGQMQVVSTAVSGQEMPGALYNNIPHHRLL